MRTRPLLFALAASLALLGACGRTPRQWIDKGKEQAAKGEAERAVEDFDRALTHSGPWTAEAKLLKARSLMDLKRYDESARCALDSTLGQSPLAARPARILALGDYAEIPDKAEGAKVYGLLGSSAALGDPAVRAAATKLGLVEASAPAPAGAPAPEEGTQAPVQRSALLKSSRLNIGQLDAVRVAIASVTRVQALDPALFPFRTEFQDPRVLVRVPSDDGLRTVWRGQDREAYWLFLGGPQGQNPKRLDACRDGYQPVWSPDSKHILYSAMDWRLEERNLFIYDIAKGRSRRAFNARRKVGGLSAWSPDGSKIVYTYQDDLWIMNADGIGRSLLNLSSRIHKPADEAQLFAWSKDGTRLAYQMRGDPTVYILLLSQKL